MSTFTLVAPIKGWVAPLDEVPDPVFADRILGDGVAIDPTGAAVHAPCDGQITSVARHAITLRAVNGAEILIHVGLETVALNGQGFTSHAHMGDSVRAGDPLLTFDLDFLAGKAKSLISPIVITNGDAFAIVRRSSGRETALGEFLMELQPRGVQTYSSAEGADVSREIVVPLAHGIHARPAAIISDAAKKFDAEIEFCARDRRANAKSIVALMSLGVAKDERVTIHARGAGAQAAADALAKLIETGIHEAPEPAIAPAAVVAGSTAPLPSNSLRGVTGAPGLAIGRAVHLNAASFEVTEQGAGIGHEMLVLHDALAVVRGRLESLAASGSRQQREILSAHVALLDDPELLRAARAAVENGKSAAFAWRHAIGACAQVFGAIDDARIRERVGDLMDLERQVLAALNGEAVLKPKDIPADAILIADELLPSELAGTIAGFCTAQGGPTSHVAILASGMGVPALVSTAGVLDIAEGTVLFLDADAGLLHIDPDAALLADARETIAARAKQDSAARAHALEDCRTADGTRIEILTNLGAGAEEARAAVTAGAEGCGLLRTEFLFLDRETPPSEDEQAQTYQAIADALGGRPLKIRTFDIGGDKPVPYLPLPPEENPALGLRGVRAGLWRSDLLKTQLAAILRVNGPVRIMLPMIASISELRAVRTMLDDLRKERTFAAQPKLGIMVETPASAVLAALFAREAEFFSIGTNDLTQYALAMDRTNAQLAAQVDAFHPAVLSLIAQAAQGGIAQNRPVAVCGGLAGDPLAAALLIGLGVRELSMAAASIPRVKEAVRGLTLDAARAAVHEALQQDSAEAVRAVAARYLPSAS